MGNFARIFTYALFTGILIGVAPAPLLAQEQPKHSDHVTLGYNEEVVKKLLEGSDPDVAFLARLKMMQGHLHAAVFASRLLRWRLTGFGLAIKGNARHSDHARRHRNMDDSTDR